MEVTPTDRLAEIRKIHKCGPTEFGTTPQGQSKTTIQLQAAIGDLLALLDEKEQAGIERDKFAAYQNLVLDNIKRERDTAAARFDAQERENAVRAAEAAARLAREVKGIETERDQEIA